MTRRDYYRFENGTILSGRQADISFLVCEGLTNKEIGNKVGLTEKTVKHHLTLVFKKLGIKSRSQLIIAINHNERLNNG